MSFRLIKDGITPDLAKKARAVGNARPALEAAGEALVSWVKRSFREGNLRISPWALKKDGTVSTLQSTPKDGKNSHSTHLRTSIEIKEVSNKHVAVGTDRVYAAVHQFGSRSATGRGGGIPARPFFPVSPAGKFLPAAEKVIGGVLKAKLDRLLRG